MFSAFERKVAFRYLRSRKKGGMISLIAMFSLVGIALGVATLIVVMAVMNGFRQEITNKILGVNGHILVSAFGPKLEDYTTLEELLKKEIPEIETITPVVNGQVLATTQYHSTGSLIKGMTLEDLRKRNLFSDNVIQGALESLETPDSVMMGSHLANQLGIFLGDQVTLVAPKGRSTAIGTLPRLKRYYVEAIFETGMYEYDNGLIILPLDAAQRFTGVRDAVSSLEIFVNDADKAEQISSRIKDVAQGDYRIHSWQTMHASLFTALKVERTVMFFILTLIVCVAAFNIISSLTMLVTDKGKDIAILRTMGASRGMIVRVFFLCGSFIGVAGTLIGLALGVAFAAHIETIRQWIESITGSRLFDPVVYFLSELPSDIQTDDVIWAASVGLFFSFLATIYPSIKAAKQDPGDALRYE